MKQLTIIFLFFSYVLHTQVNTEIHVFDLIHKNNSISISNGVNISQNPGYDSQPFFYNNNEVIFSSERDGNTDIFWYNLDNGNKRYISSTIKGGEYSPQKIPNSKDLSAVRLDDDGLQRFYRYDFKTGKYKILIPDLKVAYPNWFDKNMIVASVIVNDSLHLIASDLKKKTNTTLAKSVGRAVHNIPNSTLVSFIQKENGRNILKSIDIKSKEVKSILNLNKIEDMTWLPNGSVLFSDGYALFTFHPGRDTRPKMVYQFIDENIINISRLAVNKEGNKLALVAEVSPEYLADAQLAGYNNRDIEAFLKPFAKDVKVYRSSQLSYQGLDKMRERYAGYFAGTPDLHCKILKRIVFKNKVIDHELVTRNGQTIKAVAIYEMNGGKITKVTFL